MALSRQETDFLVEEISRHLGAKRDGAGKNLIARCPYCGKEGKFGVYIGKETLRKKPFMSHCFSCGRSTQTLEKLLEEIGRPDLMVTPTADLTTPLDTNLLFPLDMEEEVDDTLGIVELPDFYTRVYTHPYLKSRGFCYDDYDYFEVGTTGKLNFRFTDYVIFPVIDRKMKSIFITGKLNVGASTRSGGSIIPRRMILSGCFITTIRLLKMKPIR